MVYALCYTIDKVLHQESCTKLEEQLLLQVESIQQLEKELTQVGANCTAQIHDLNIDHETLEAKVSNNYS